MEITIPQILEQTKENRNPTKLNLYPEELNILADSMRERVADREAVRSNALQKKSARMKNFEKRVFLKFKEARKMWIVIMELCHDEITNKF